MGNTALRNLHKKMQANATFLEGRSTQDSSMIFGYSRSERSKEEDDTQDSPDHEIESHTIVVSFRCRASCDSRYGTRRLLSSGEARRDSERRLNENSVRDPKTA